MDTKNLVVAGVMLMIGLGVGFTLGDAEDREITGMHHMGDGTQMGQNIDQHFIVQMIPHHEGAIEMAKVALEKSKRPEMIALANGIIEAQMREITDMTAWYSSWFGGVPPKGGMGAMGGMHMDGMTGDMADLRAASATEFDREFIDQMIPHHEMAVMMASMLQGSTQRPEMQQLAQDIISSQSSEIEMMRGWRSAWYQ